MAYSVQKALFISQQVLDIKHSALLQFLVLDIPGKLLTREDGVDQILEHLREPPGAASASSASRASLVYVIDAQEDPFDEAIAHGKRLITSLLEKFPKTEVEIFVHKSDGEMIADDEGNKQVGGLSEVFHAPGLLQHRAESLHNDSALCWRRPGLLFLSGHRCS